LLLVAIAAAPRRVLALAGGLAIASFVWMQVLYDPASPSRVYFGTDTRLASILLGAALAAWIARRGHVARGRPRVTLEVAAWSSVVLLAYAWVRLDGSSTVLYRGGLFLTALAVACVIAAAVHPQRGGISRVLSFGPLWRSDSSATASTCGTGRSTCGSTRRTCAPRRLGARHAAHLDHDRVATLSYLLLEQPIRHGDPRSGAATAVPRSSACSLSASCSRPRRRHAARRLDPMRRDSAAHSRASVGGWELRRAVPRRRGLQDVVHERIDSAEPARSSCTIVPIDQG
jgi:hypothetical protein